MRNAFPWFGRAGSLTLILTQLLACSSSQETQTTGDEHGGTQTPEAGPITNPTTEANDSTSSVSKTSTSHDGATESTSVHAPTSPAPSSSDDPASTTSTEPRTSVDTQDATDCDGCLVDGQCWPAGALERGNLCAACRPELSTTSASPVDGAPACDDGDPCTTNDACSSGQCVGTAKVCDDGVGCNGTETCSTQTGACIAGTSTCDTGVCNLETDQCVVACPNGCLVDGVCYNAGEQSSASLGCLVCDPAQSATSLIAAAGEPCSIAPDYCVLGGVCSNEGTCEPQYRPEGTPCGTGDNSANNTNDDPWAQGYSSGPWGDAGARLDTCAVSTCNADGQCVTEFAEEGLLCGDFRLRCHDWNHCDGAGGCVLGDPQPLGSVCGIGVCVGDAERPECACPEGMEGEFGACRDINECALNLATCDRAPEACVNDWGSYHCECPSPFTGDGQGKSGCQCDRDDYSPLCKPWSFVASAYLSACGISDGALFCWGENTESELGLGDELSRAVPTRVGTANDWEFVAKGYDHTCGIRAGALYCWGEAGLGQLGHNGNGLTPERVGTNADWIAVAAGIASTCGLRGDGELYCWGWNSYGQVGVGTETTYYSSPQRVTSFNGFTAVKMSLTRACALRAGSLFCWGEAYLSELVDRRSPDVVPGVTDFTDFDLDTSGGCAVQGSGALQCWENELAPGVVPGRDDWATISTAFNHYCGLTQSGAAYCWGVGVYGELGAGALVATTDTPVAVDGFSSWTQIEAGQQTTYGIHEGALYAWGANDTGSRGTGITIGRVGTASDWTSVSTSLSFSCGIRAPGELYCWGSVPPGTTPSGPVRIGSADDWTKVVVGWGHACGIRAPGDLYCFGSNDYGQLGDGTKTDSPEPVRVGANSDWTEVTVSVQTATGYTCGIASLGQLSCWGANGSGQLGDGSTTARTAPTNVGGLEWTEISAGADVTCGVRAGGLYCWGDASSGKIGTGASSGTRTTPRLVDSGPGWGKVAMGFSHGCAIDADTPYCWGSSPFGALGLGTLPLTPQTPAPVASAETFVAIGAGTFFTCGLNDGGALSCWGQNAYGQLLHDDFANQWSPVPAATDLNWDVLSTGNYHACGLSNGNVYCWGENDRDVLGTGEGFTPTLVANEL